MKLLELKFTSPSEIARRALRKGLQIRRNLESAVAETVLFGVTRIAMDTPVQTGRARANIAGEFGDMVDLDGPEVDPAAVAEGRRQSPTFLNAAGLEGAIGANVEYIIPLEFGHRVAVRSVSGRTYYKRKDQKIQVVPGKAMFRKNIPDIRALFKQRCRLALQRGLRGEGMGGDG